MTKRVAWFTGEPSVEECFTPYKVYEVVQEEDTNFKIINDMGIKNYCLKKGCAHICHNDWMFADVVEQTKNQEKVKKWSKWIKHTTGEQPVPSNVLVKVKFSKDTDHTEIEYAGNWEWFKHGHDGDGAIRYYKVKLEDLDKIVTPLKPKSKWTKNEGMNPVDTDVDVKIVRRDSGKVVMRARYCDWSLSGHSYDIIKWRLAD